MKLQSLSVIFIIIIIPVVLLETLYISSGIKTIKYQSVYDSALVTAVHDALYAYELNTTNNSYAVNAETKRNLLKASVNVFEKELCNTCKISAYNTSEIEEYIPAILFGMYDGFYVYAPTYNSQTKKYEHSLKNYVYYSETINLNNAYNDELVIRYSLDNYIIITGNINGEYKTLEGYLMVLDNSTEDGLKYNNVKIDTTDESAKQYYIHAYEFSELISKLNGIPYYLKISNENDPENENSEFCIHKRKIMKEKIEEVLNTTITAYSNRTFGQVYKMPKFTEEDWEKIYSNISMAAFFQGKRIGLTKYNGYCVLNSTNSNDYVNPSLIYFTDSNGEYHDIRCNQKASETGIRAGLTGYRIESFKKYITTEETGTGENLVRTTQYNYQQEETACYNCINGSKNTTKTVYEYITDDIDSTDKEKTAYWTALGRERYESAKLFSTPSCNTMYNLNNLEYTNKTLNVPYGTKNYFTTLSIKEENNTIKLPENITITMNGRILEQGSGKDYLYNPKTGEVTIFKITGDIQITAEPQKVKFTITHNFTGLAYKETATVEYGSNYETNIVVENSFKYNLPNEIMVTMMGKGILTCGTDYTYDKSIGKIVINNITGNVEIYANASIKRFRIIRNLINITSSNESNEIDICEEYQTTFTALNGASILASNIKVTRGGVALVKNQDYEFDASTGKLKIYKNIISGDIRITLESRFLCNGGALCRSCNGGGKTSSRCGTCGGDGSVECSNCSGVGTIPCPGTPECTSQKTGQDCSECEKGKGTVTYDEYKCSTCGVTGYSWYCSSCRINPNTSNHPYSRISCSNCYKGSYTCSVCTNGNVESKCTNCNGTGKTLCTHNLRDAHYYCSHGYIQEHNID